MSATRNASSMKIGNMLEILGMLQRGPVCRADVARQTGLTRAAVTIIVDRLESHGLVGERGAREGGQGRKPILLDILDGRLCFLGVDITRVDCSIGVVDIKGSILAHTAFALSPEDSLDHVLPRIRKGLRSVCGQVERAPLGMGVSVPGPVDSSTGRVLNPPNFPMLHGQNLLEQLQGAADCGVWVDNNAAARALYEKNVGAGRRYGSFMTMTVDTGIGSGLVLDGRLYRGAGFAGEAGHTSIDIHGPRCACGNKGCLELYASIPALLRRQCAGRPDLETWKDVVDGALLGDALCRQVVDREAEYLSQGILNVANLLDLEAVILAGYVAYRPEPLLDGIRRAVQGSRIAAGTHGLEVLASGVAEHAGVAGAAMVAVERFLSGETGWDLPS